MICIVDGKRNFGATHWDVVTRHPAYARVAQLFGVTVPPQTAVAPGPPLKARLYRNQWIVDCPDCRGADFVWTDEANPLQMCGSCLNATVDHKWRRVELPPDRVQIEAIVKARPLPQNRNWVPGETVAALKRDNREHGLPEGVV